MSIANLQKFQFNETSIYLEDFEHGKGKIIITNPLQGSYSYIWGSMGSSLSDFLLEINSDYFAKNLCPNPYCFDAKASVTNLRKYIRNDLNYDLPWYQYMSAQKEMRQHIKQLELCSEQWEFVDRMMSLPNHLLCLDLNKREEIDFRSIIEDLFRNEPWNFIAQKHSSNYLWLYELHGKIKKKLQNNKNCTIPIVEFKGKICVKCGKHVNEH